MDNICSSAYRFCLLLALFASAIQAELTIRFKPIIPRPRDLLRIEITATGKVTSEVLEVTIIRYEDRNGDCFYDGEEEREQFQQLVRLKPSDDNSSESQVEFAFQTIGEAPQALRYVAGVSYRGASYYDSTPVITDGNDLGKTCAVRLPSVWKLGIDARDKLLESLSAWKDRLTRRVAGKCSGVIWSKRGARCHSLALPTGFAAQSVALSPEGRRLAVLGDTEETDSLLWTNLGFPSSFRSLSEDSLLQVGKITTAAWMTEVSILAVDSREAYVFEILTGKVSTFASDVLIQEILAVRHLRVGLSRIIVIGRRSVDIAPRIYSLEGGPPWTEIRSEELVTSELWLLAKWTSEKGKRYARGVSESLLEGRGKKGKESQICRAADGWVGDISWSKNGVLAALVCR